MSKTVQSAWQCSKIFQELSRTTTIALRCHHSYTRISPIFQVVTIRGKYSGLCDLGIIRILYTIYVSKWRRLSLYLMDAWEIDYAPYMPWRFPSRQKMSDSRPMMYRLWITYKAKYENQRQLGLRWVYSSKNSAAMMNSGDCITYDSVRPSREIDGDEAS
jgi:hypothetical protein